MYLNDGGKGTALNLMGHWLPESGWDVKVKVVFHTAHAGAQDRLLRCEQPLRLKMRQVRAYWSKCKWYRAIRLPDPVWKQGRSLVYT